MKVNKLFSKYRLKKKEGLIFDVIRDKWLKMTPEEIVRQQMIQYMLDVMKIPKEYIGVEKALSTLGLSGNRKRVDICVWDENKNVLGIVECKAFHISNNEEPYQQVLDYVRELKAQYFFVTDGIDLYGYAYCEHLDQFVYMENPIEEYERLFKSNKV